MNTANSSDINETGFPEIQDRRDTFNRIGGMGLLLLQRHFSIWEALYPN
jgi:hypothetical protein